MKVDIAGVFVDAVTKSETLNKLDEFLQAQQPRLVVTVYSEFIVFASHEDTYKRVLNHADLSLADGFGILWAAKYLSLPVLNPLLELLRLMLNLSRALFDKAYFKTVLPEVITGSRLVWDIAKLAAEKNYSLALVGGFNGVALAASQKLLEHYPNLKFNLVLSPAAFDDSVAEQINRSNSDILLIAYSPPKQEMWLAENLGKLNVKVALGLGGTFDYLAGKRVPAPNFISRLGLEWLWRLLTQPWRIKRMWNAVPNFIWTTYRYKLVNRKQ